MKRPRGFTLIELLVVIAIIGLLSSIVLASLNTARQKGQIGAVQETLHSFAIAFELYLSSHSTYPPNADNCTSCQNPCNASGWATVTNELKAKGAMSNPPATDPWGKAWCYDNNYNQPDQTLPTMLCSSGPNGANETVAGSQTYKDGIAGGDDICRIIAPRQK